MLYPPNPDFERFINELGGAKALSVTMFGHKNKRQMIHHWAKRGQIPFRWRPDMVRLAKKQGVRVPDDFFNPQPAQVEA